MQFGKWTITRALSTLFLLFSLIGSRRSSSSENTDTHEKRNVGSKKGQLNEVIEHIDGNCNALICIGPSNFNPWNEKCKIVADTSNLQWLT